MIQLLYNRTMTVAIGIDGCKGGWFFFRFDGDTGTFGVASDITEVLEGVPPDAHVLIDIPIGLKERGKVERECDVEARALLRPSRHSSVFSAPCRQASQLDDYESASKKNKKITGRSLSRQCWGIVPKIREVDELLRARNRIGGTLWEAHPELVFRGLAGGPMSANKKSREGFAERMTILQIFEPDAKTYIAAAFLAHGGFDAGRDDIVDAYVLALCAKHPGRWRRVPEVPVTDPKGLVMQMVYMQP
ncbi:MAG: DUF429 domain-containing protein [Gammaproteobacteria bacterium]|nr:MAG: DUF429 domain-containing protein [Gammaproteobacteria bacterium]